jgi:SpoVK/Ycf46/Vps4 family AAA+-type ATPase
MARRTVADDDSDAETVTRRARKRVSYNEDDSEELAAGDAAADDDDDEAPRRGRKRTRTAVAAARSDDSDFHASEADDDEVDDALDDDFERAPEPKFVASDDDGDDEADYGYGARRGRRKLKRRRSLSPEPKVLRGGRTTRGSARHSGAGSEAGSGGDDDTLDLIQKEVQELYDLSPDASPVRHKLRERSARIDYTIPPPINPDHPDYANGAAARAVGSQPPPPARRGRGRPPASEFRRTLFPTAGPFGGSDVVSLFGRNIPPGDAGGGAPALGAPPTAIGGSDSDSSDDERAAAAAASGGGPAAQVNHTKLITLGTSSGKQKNNLSDTDPLGVDMNIDFSAVGGLANYINQLKEMVALPLLYPELYQNFGLTPPRGVLFHGPPGTGKTLMARALAASCSTAERKITFFMRKGADCLSKWVGEAERQLRLLFEEAKNQQPSIIFFDEIDGLAPVRLLKQEQIHASIVSTLLALMDGMDNRGQVIVIGATNRPDLVDPALRRPGRFDREFYFPLPDLPARHEILQIHTRKWHPPLAPQFLHKVAGLTKGYGGADLRALCTEAALNSIQRKYPQIYQSDDKLQVDPTKVRVNARDFMRAIDKIVPSSARSTSSGSSPLPDHLRPLLGDVLHETGTKLEALLPGSIKRDASKKLTTLEEAHYYDPTVHDSDGGFARQELLRNLESARVCKPHLLICGEAGNGQQYVSAAILNQLEGFQVQSLDMGAIFGDATRTPELSIVQAFVEARRHQPSVIVIPSVDLWFEVLPPLARATLAALLRLLRSSERVLLLGVAESAAEHLDAAISQTFHANVAANTIHLHNPSRQQRHAYFDTLRRTLQMKPYEFTNDLANRPRRKLRVLPKAAVPKPEDAAQQRRRQRDLEYQDTKLKNVLKLKLAGLMDLFKNRYKRFKKSIIDDFYLYHLFEPLVLDPANPQHQALNYEVLYERLTDPKHENMIREISTGRYYYNMNLDIIEERLWNGYYLEPKQFLRDIKMVVKDLVTLGDRERILKANEMLTNAQFGVDDFSTPEFLSACREMRAREVERQERILEGERNGHAAAAAAADAASAAVALQPAVLAHEPAAAAAAAAAAAVAAVQDATTEPVAAVKEDAVTAPSANGAVVNGATDAAVPAAYGTDAAADAAAEPAAEPAAAADSSESEAEPLPQPDRELVLDARADEFFSSLLPELTDDFGVEKLELVMARFMEIVWADRGQWDRRGTILKLIDAARDLSLVL